MHSMELPLKEVVIKIAGRPQQLRLQIERCESIGEGWYISGGKLVGRNAWRDVLPSLRSSLRASTKFGAVFLPSPRTKSRTPHCPAEVRIRTPLVLVFLKRYIYGMSDAARVELSRSAAER